MPRRKGADGLMHAVTVPDHVDVLAGMACGAAAHLRVSAVTGLPPPDECWLFGSEGTLRLDAATAKVPIIMLTAKAAEIDRVLGLELGADDYLTKPFSPRELLLRVKKILARFQTEEKPKEQLRFGDLLIDLPRHIVSWKNKPIEMTATEFKLITVLAQRAGRVQSRDQLLRDVWEYDSLIDTRTVDTHMRRLREKLGAASKHLDTVRGVGYRFVE